MPQTRRADAEDAIAVIGIGCRYADARGPEQFWEICLSGRDTVREAPRHRVELGYDLDHFYDPRPRVPGKISSKKGGFLEHPELFDPAAFGIAPRDALTMEPQQRLMVEVTWDALEDAGIPPESVAGERVAVILGYMAEDYSRERTGVLGEEAVFRGHDVFTVGGMSHAVLSGRISFLLGLTGPSLTLDTACSSSLIATHLAVQSLRRGESDLALAGGANLFLSPEGNIALSRSGMLSLSGRCRAFDAGADGFVRAEGAGVVVLKRLAEARADGDPVYAVIRGSGISTDGRDGGHMMAPGRHGQAQAMRDAYAQAGVDPASVHYVEAHGTGTMIGDPVEIAALADVMGPGRDPARPLRVASVKGNLGHAESASGVAGLIKACLAIRHRKLPAQLHFETPNPMIPWDEVPVRVQAETTDWPVEGPALAGVNSFGISGTNAHVVLESPPAEAARGEAFRRTVPAAGGAVRPVRRPWLLPLSAHDPNALHDLAEAIRARLDDVEGEALEDLLFTAARRRAHRGRRMSVVGRSVEALRAALDAYLAGESSPDLLTGVAPADRQPGLVMVFPGQGSQWPEMGRSLLEAEPVFAAAIDRLDGAYAEHVDWSLRRVLEGRADFDWTTRLDVLQPVLVAFEIALAGLWESWGVRPTRVVGQSMGEIAAAHVAGALSIDDVATLACHRGRIVARATGAGGMAVVALPRAEVEARLAAGRAGVEVAGVNSPTTTIVSGDRAAVRELVDALEAEGVFARALEVDFASHCFHMDPLLEDFRAGIASIRPRPPQIPFHSTVDGSVDENESTAEVEAATSGPDLGPDYWVRNLRAAVAFDRGLGAAIDAGGELFLEVSPHPTLPRPIEEIARSRGRQAGFAASLARDEDASLALARSLASLHVRGAPVDFAAFGPGGRVVPLPLYPYQRERYWFSERSRLDQHRPVHPFLGLRSESSLDPRLSSWDFVLDADAAGFVADTTLEGSPIVGTGLFVELACAVAAARWPGEPVALEALEVLRPIELGVGGRRRVQVVLESMDGAPPRLRIASRAGDDAPWQLHARVRLARGGGRASGEGDRDAEPKSIRADRTHARLELSPLDPTEATPLPQDAYHEALRRAGLAFGARSTTLRELARPTPAVIGTDAEATPGDAVLGRLMLPRAVESEWHAFHAHPALIESALQLAAVLGEDERAVRVESVESFRVEGGLGSDCWCRATRRRSSARGADGFVVDFGFYDRAGQPIGALEGVALRPLPASATGRGTRTSGTLHRVEWRALPESVAEARRVVDRWIVVSDDATEAGLLASELQKLDVQCRFCEKVEDLAPLVEIMQADRRAWGLVVLAWGAGSRAIATSSADEGDEAAEPVERPDHRAYRVGSWAEAIRRHALDAAEIWIATRGLQTVGPDEHRAGAIARRVAREIDTFTDVVELQRCRLFDAGPEPTPAERRRLAALLGLEVAERQLVVRGEAAYVPRLVPLDEGDERTAGAPVTPAGARNFRATLDAASGRVVLRTAPEPRPGPGEVVVEVRAAGLSQLDVLAGLGLARPDSAPAPALGHDFAGVVTAVGEGVDDLSVGDAVVGVQPGATARRRVVKRAFVIPMPQGLDFHEAASRAWPALVAHHALDRVGRVRAGERVLVLSAGGGVGHALVAVARSLGAEVTVTARDPRRRRALARAGLRVVVSGDHPAAAEGAAPSDAERLAEDERFDLIVGAESGPALHGWLARLAAGGRYLDLCPRGDFERPELGVLRLEPNRSITAIDTCSLLRDEPEAVASLLEQGFERLEDAVLAMPSTRFPLAAAERALRFMVQNRHRGRVCLDFGGAEAVPVQADPEARRTRLAEPAGGWLVTGRPGPLRSRLVAWLRARGADPIVEASETAAVGDDALLASPLAGWVHVSAEHDPERTAIRERMRAAPAARRLFVSQRARPEIAEAPETAHPRAWEMRLWVDRLSAPESGEPGGWLDLCVGPEVGEAALNRALDRSLDVLDDPIEALAPSSEGLAATESIDAGFGLVLLDEAERQLREAAGPSPYLALLGDTGEASGSRRFTRAELAAMTPPERRVAMQSLVVAELATVLGLSESAREALDPASRLDTLGLDSLMSLELFMGLGRALELEIAADWFDSVPSLSEIASTLAERAEAADRRRGAGA